MFFIFCHSLDGCCRHVAATLFEIVEFQNDNNKSSVTSGKCAWVQRASKKPSEAMEATGLQTGVTSDRCRQTEGFNPVPEAIPLPEPASFFNMVKKNGPEACILDTWEVRPEPVFITPDLPTLTPADKINIFLQSHICTIDNVCSSQCFEELYQFLEYSEEEMKLVDIATRGQTCNTNWHGMRKNLLTASNFKLICHSRNGIKTAMSMLSGPDFDQKTPPAHIEFGQRYECKARELFMKGHKFIHKKCVIEVPGLILNNKFPFLGASPDGILHCEKCLTKHLVEIKCISSKRHYQPSVALALAGICNKEEDGTLVMNKSHSYYYQIQGQMAICEISKCWLVGYTHKGVHPLLIEFDSHFWQSTLEKLDVFYTESFYPVLKGGFAK